MGVKNSDFLCLDVIASFFCFCFYSLMADDLYHNGLTQNVVTKYVWFTLGNKLFHTKFYIFHNLSEICFSKVKSTQAFVVLHSSADWTLCIQQFEKNKNDLYQFFCFQNSSVTDIFSCQMNQQLYILTHKKMFVLYNFEKKCWSS